MKVILLEDVKGKGKKYEEKDFPNGYANFLIKNNQAVLANDTNRNKIKDELTLQLEKETLKMFEAIDKRNTINNSLIVVERKAMPDGSINKSFSKKELIEKLNEKYPDIKIESKMIKMYPIKTFGKHYAYIEMYKDVFAVIEVDVVCTQN